MNENMNVVNSTLSLEVSQYNVSFGFSIANIEGIPTPFAYRPEINVDMGIINSIFIGQEYNLPIENFQPKLILDCGANIGCSAVYFANKYPEAQIYSIEPSKENFKLLQFNTLMYDNIHAINSALWDKETILGVDFSEMYPGSPLGCMVFETEKNAPHIFKSTTVAKLLADSGFDEIDLLKIDIEGSEKEVFSAPDVDKWLSKVKVLTIELHDRMKPGCSRAFFKAISKYNWHFELRGENLIFIRAD